MHRRIGVIAGIVSSATVVALCWTTAARAQQQTTFTKFTGTAVGSGTWSRTIIDISEPNEPGEATIQSSYVVMVPWTNGMTAQQVSNAYRAACLASLPGYGAVSENTVQPTVRMSKHLGTYNIGADGPYPTGVTVTTYLPSNAADAPAASPGGLAAAAAGLTALAWWARRRRMAA